MRFGKLGSGTESQPGPDGDATFFDPEPAWPDQPRSSRTRRQIAGLLVVLGMITVAGVLTGKALEPGAKRNTASPQVRPTPAAGSAVVKPRSARRSWGPLSARPFGRLPAVANIAAGVISGDRLVVLGGRAAAGSDSVYAGHAGSALKLVGKLPAPLKAAAAFTAGGDVLVVGGEHGSSPTDEILRIDLAKHEVTSAGRFNEPLAEAGVVAQDGAVYLVGGWTGEKYATAVLRFVPPSQTTVVARLPEGTRSPAVALVGKRLYVAGGLTQSGRSRKVFSVDTESGEVKALGELPQAVAQAMLMVTRSTDGNSLLYLIGGRAAGGRPVKTIVRLNPRTGAATPVGSVPEPLVKALMLPFGKRSVVIGTTSGTIYRVG
jgi:hypothetical protein